MTDEDGTVGIRSRAVGGDLVDSFQRDHRRLELAYQKKASDSQPVPAST